MLKAPSCTTKPIRSNPRVKRLERIAAPAGAKIQSTAKTGVKYRGPHAGSPLKAVTEAKNRVNTVIDAPSERQNSGSARDQSRIPTRPRTSVGL